MSKILEIKSLYAGYGEEVVLRDVNLLVNTHDFIGIIGPNGGGKTTLLKVMMGLIRPMQGSVGIAGIEPHRSVFGYLPQGSAIDKSFPIPVIDVVLSGLLRENRLIRLGSRKDKAKACELLERMGIRDLRDKVIGELSGGQLQRVLLARAVISSPHILVLDEPNTFVDSNFERDLYQLLLELNKDMAILLVSHDLGMVSSHVKTIACVNRGLHLHASNLITEEVLASYNCPIDLIAHGELPHRILKEHKH